MKYVIKVSNIMSSTKISEIFGLNKSQSELDFVDIDVSKDTNLFVDPVLLGLNEDKWSVEAKNTLRSFFSKLLQYIIEGKEKNAKEMFKHLGEPNATCLGLSRNNPKGKGVGDLDTLRIYDSIVESKAAQTGLIQDIEDNILFVDNFGKDKLSDMTTNIIIKHLMDYTIQQCILHKIPLKEKANHEQYWWCSDKEEWVNSPYLFLVVNEKIKILVPKGIVSYCKAYTHEKYYNNYVLNFIKNEELSLGSSLVYKKKNGDYNILKKDLKKENPISKKFLREFSSKNILTLKSFKEETKVYPLRNSEILKKDILEIKEELLKKVSSLNDYTIAFSQFMIGILEFIFYPYLLNPSSHFFDIQELEEKNIFFFEKSFKTTLLNNITVNNRKVAFYCKKTFDNSIYLDLKQLANLLDNCSICFIVCHSIAEPNDFKQFCKTLYKDTQKVFLPITNEDIYSLLNNYSEEDCKFIEEHMSSIFSDYLGCEL